MEKPRIYVNFKSGHLFAQLPRLAYDALTEAGLPIQALVNDLRNFGKQKQLANQRAAPLMRIISKYVEPRPLNYRDMFTELGPKEALRYIPGEQPPDSVWALLMELRNDSKHPGLADRFYDDFLTAVANSAGRFVYGSLVTHYRYAARGRSPERVPSKPKVKALTR